MVLTQAPYPPKQHQLVRATLFLEEIVSTMKDVESSVGKYMQAMMKVVAKHLGGVEVMSYLGDLFSISLNFQTSIGSWS